MFPLVPRTTNVAALMGARTDPDALAWQMAVVGAGGTVSAGYLAAVSAFIAGMKADGTWQKLDVFWWYAAENAFQASIDFVQRLSHMLVNSPTFGALQGYNGDGSTSYINSTYDPVTKGTHYLQNDAMYGVDSPVADSRSSSFFILTSSNGGGASNGLGLSSNNTQFNWSCNDSSTSENTTFSTKTGLICVERTAAGSGGNKIYQEGAALGTGTNASGSVTNGNFFVCCSNNNGAGSPAGFTNARIRGFLAGVLRAQPATRTSRADETPSSPR
jgi:hypothetical protein